MKTVKQRLDDLLWEKYSMEDLTENTTQEDFGFDSINWMDFAFDVEDAFGISMQTEELTACKTYGEIIALVEVKWLTPTK